MFVSAQNTLHCQADNYVVGVTNFTLLSDIIDGYTPDDCCVYRGWNVAICGVLRQLWARHPESDSSTP